MFDLQVELFPELVADIVLNERCDVGVLFVCRLVSLDKGNLGLVVSLESVLKELGLQQDNRCVLHGFSDFKPSTVEDVEFIPLFEFVVILTELFDNGAIGGQQSKSFFQVSKCDVVAFSL